MSMLMADKNLNPGEPLEFHAAEIKPLKYVPVVKAKASCLF